MKDQDRKWWKEAVIYQVYPRSFKDSNNDGVGDLPGILSKLDYLQSLGIDVIWLNPVYASPNDDNGYDISNYEAIAPVFGTITDFTSLVAGLHSRGIKLIMDLVINHTSDEHPWFVESRKSRDNPYRDFYHWWPAEKGAPPARYSFFDPKSDAWRYDSVTNAYYLHYFSNKQPDLNWENAAVRKAVYQMMRFWLDKGVDGFRMDAISYISKDSSWPVVSQDDLKNKYRGDWSYFYSKGPNLHAYLQEMNREVMTHYDIACIAETPGIEKEEALLFVGKDRNELQMLYHFKGMELGYLPEGFKRPDPAGYRLPAFKKLYSAWDAAFGDSGWGTVYLGNHDLPRMVSRWGNDSSEYRRASTKLLMTFLLTMRATPIFYNGDELGMKNARFEKISDYRDIETLSRYQALFNRDNMQEADTFLKDQQFSARDNGRTPFQWTAGEHAGFSAAVPWIRINADHVFINAEAQEADVDSPLHYFRRILRLRKQKTALIYGKYALHDEAHEQVYAYTREENNVKILVVLNFSPGLVHYTLPGSLSFAKYTVLLNNETCFHLQDRQLILLPYQALIFECS